MNWQPAGLGLVTGCLQRAGIGSAVGPAYGMARLVGVSDYVRDVIDALTAKG
jgi:hypothetical protein